MVKKYTGKISEKTTEFSFFLAPSKIAGVGVFATHDIKKGVVLRLFPDGTRFFPKLKKASSESLKLKQKFLNRFCIESEKGYFCAKDFGKMCVGWFLNHSDNPNSFSNEKDIYFSKKDIKKGEEITADYTSFCPTKNLPKFGINDKI